MESKSVFTPPVMEGDKATRRCLRAVTQTCAVYEREFNIASRTRSLHVITRANQSRSSLESELVALESVTRVGPTLRPKVQDAIETGRNLLINTHLLDPANAVPGALVNEDISNPVTGSPLSLSDDYFDPDDFTDDEDENVNFETTLPPRDPVSDAERESVAAALLTSSSAEFESSPRAVASVPYSRGLVPVPGAVSGPAPTFPNAALVFPPIAELRTVPETTPLTSDPIVTPRCQVAGNVDGSSRMAAHRVGEFTTLVRSTVASVISTVAGTFRPIWGLSQRNNRNTSTASVSGVQPVHHSTPSSVTSVPGVQPVHCPPPSSFTQPFSPSVSLPTTAGRSAGYRASQAQRRQRASPTASMTSMSSRHEQATEEQDARRRHRQEVSDLQRQRDSLVAASQLQLAQEAERSRAIAECDVRISESCELERVRQAEVTDDGGFYALGNVRQNVNQGVAGASSSGGTGCGKALEQGESGVGTRCVSSLECGPRMSVLVPASASRTGFAPVNSRVNVRATPIDARLQALSVMPVGNINGNSVPSSSTQNYSAPPIPHVGFGSAGPTSTACAGQDSSHTFVNTSSRSSGFQGVPQSSRGPAMPGPQPSTSGLEVGGDASGGSSDLHNLDKLLGVNAKSNARELLVARRPQSDRRFSGDVENQDFEAFVRRFDRYTNVEGVDDEMRLMEVQHYVTGTAAIIATSYEDVPDAKEALRLIKAHWRREFGKRVYTARQLLDGHLKGGPLKPENATAIRTFICNLEAVYRQSSGSARALLFDSPDLMNEILRRRLPTFSRKWAQKLQDVLVKQSEEGGENVRDLSFADFLKYLTQANGVQLHELAIHKRTSFSSFSDAPATATTHRWKFAKVAAADVEVAEDEEEVEEEPDELESIESGGDESPLPPAEVAVAASMTSRPKAKGKASTPPAPSGPMLRPEYLAGSTGSPESAGGQRSCVACKDNGAQGHPLQNCRVFLKASVLERSQLVRDHALCRVCFLPGHWASMCRSRAMCRVLVKGRECGRDHHTLLHRDVSQVGPSSPMTPS